MAAAATAPRSLQDWLAYQQRAHASVIDMGLERVRTVGSRLGLISKSAPTAIVGGTNGKGSTSTLLADLLTACGRRTGLFTSPHLVRYQERVRIDGKMLSEAQLVAAFERIEAARDTTTLTPFEYNTLAALDIFREQGVEAMVLEVGLGGRLDATNIIDADVAVLCSVGMDHTDWLGSTLERIGAEKAGILRAGAPLVLGNADMPSTVWARAQALQCPTWVPGRDFSWQVAGDPYQAASWSYHSRLCTLAILPAPALAGEVQYGNAATAITTALLLGVQRAADPVRVARMLRGVALPGRFQIVPGVVEWILDVAHNLPAAQVLARALAARPCQGRTIAVLGMLADKDAAAVAQTLDPLVDLWILAGTDGEPRGLGAGELAVRLGMLRGSVELQPDVPQACTRARAQAHPHDRVLVFGSFHVVGPALEWLGLY